MKLIIKTPNPYSILAVMAGVSLGVTAAVVLAVVLWLVRP